MWYLGNGALAKKDATVFQSRLPKISVVALSLSKTCIMMPNENVITNMIWDKIFNMSQVKFEEDSL